MLNKYYYICKVPTSKSTFYFVLFCTKPLLLLARVFLLKKNIKKIVFCIKLFYTFAKQKIKQNEIKSIN